MRAVFVGGVVELTVVVFVRGLVCVVVVVVCFVWFVIFGEVSWVSTGWSVLLCLGWLGFWVVFPVGEYGPVGFSVVVFVRFGFGVFMVRECGCVQCGYVGEWAVSAFGYDWFMGLGECEGYEECR